MTYKVV